MIRFSLKCADGHAFDSWFASGSAFDDLAARGLLSCAVCGAGGVEKALMAPEVAPKAEARPLAAPASALEAKVAALRAKVESEATYVGPRFAAEARAQHDGEKPDGPIWGEANLAEAKSLIDDGIPVAPLPFGPMKKAN